MPGSRLDADHPENGVLIPCRNTTEAEGGSNVCFLANKKRRYEPLSRLFDKVSQKLVDRALIISGGVLVDRRLKRKLREQQFVFGTFEWMRVGSIGGRGRRTPIWEVVRLSAS